MEGPFLFGISAIHILLVLLAGTAALDVLVLILLALLALLLSGLLAGPLLVLVLLLLLTFLARRIVLVHVLLHGWGVIQPMTKPVPLPPGSGGTLEFLRFLRSASLHKEAACRVSRLQHRRTI